MAQKSWQLNRRDMLRGCGIALSLPFLNGMNWSGASASIADSVVAGATPKRMMVSYIAYGTYMPDGPSGVVRNGLAEPHHDWSWWPRRDAGELTFNQSAAPFEPLKDYVTYLRGLDHAGGWSMGGHSAGDVFATGADMSEHEPTNNISIDQVAANVHGLVDVRWAQP